MLTSASEDDISAVLCFVLEPEQISFSTPTQSEPAVAEASFGSGRRAGTCACAGRERRAACRQTGRRSGGSAESARQASESTSIRVAVEKVDQLINLVGELVITSRCWRSAPARSIR